MAWLSTAWAAVKAVLAFERLAGWLRDWIKMRNAERLGRAEQREKQRWIDDEAIKKGTAARGAAERGSRDGGLREDDGFKRQ